MKKWILILTVILTPALTAIGCSNLEIKNFFASVEKIEQLVCSGETAAERAWAVAKIREKIPDYPADGICGRIESFEHLLESDDSAAG